MKTFVIKIGVFLLISNCMVAVVFWLLPYPKSYGYHLVQGDIIEKVAWNYNRIFLSEEPIDIAFIGTSQSYYGIQDTLIENLLSEQDAATTVANLAFPGLGRNQQYVVADDLFSKKKTKILIIEVMEREKRASHQAAVYMACNEQAARFLTPVNFKLVRDLNGFYTSRKGYLRALLMGKKNDREHPSSVNGGSSFKTVDRVFTRQEMEQKKRDLEKLMNPPILPEKFRHLEYGLPLSMLEDICSTARSKDVQCYFLYVARYGALETPYPYFMKIYQKYGEVLIPPAKIWSNPSFYCDSHHLNKDGSEALSRWISKKLGDPDH